MDNTTSVKDLHPQVRSFRRGSTYALFSLVSD